MKPLIEYILQNSLPEGTDCAVRQLENDLGVTFEIEIPTEFRGKIIGKGGNNIKSLRDVVNIIARKQQKRVFLKIVD